ncbi:MAG: hypothetical protein ACREN8_04015 [Candidatus Dormibacteraceae bacterium]
MSLLVLVTPLNNLVTCMAMIAKRNSSNKPVGLPLADLIYLRRKQLGLTQEALALRLQKEADSGGSWSGATPQLIHRYELGATPRSDTLSWLSTSLHLSVEMLKELARQQRARLENANPLPAAQLGYLQMNPAMVDSTAGGSEEVERREFAKVGFVGALGILPGVDMDRLRAVLGGTRLDEQSLDQLQAVTDALMRKSWDAHPQALLPAVAGHFSGFGNVLLRVPPKFSTHVLSMAGEVAFLAGYLSLKSGLKTDADFYWQSSEWMAQSAGNTKLQSIILTLQGWQAYYEGQLDQAKTIFCSAQSALGANPDPKIAALVYSSHAYPLAATGQEQSATKNIQAADRYLNRIPGNDAWLYILESIHDEVDLARGLHLFHLRQHEESAQIFGQILKRVDPTWKASQANLLAHLGSVYAQQGHVEQAAHTFSGALNMAREAAAPRYEQRTVAMRKQWLGNNDSPAVKRLDEEFLTF